MGVIVASVLYGALLLLFAAVGPISLVLYIRHRAHPAIRPRTPWLVLLSECYTLSLSLALIVQQLLPHLPHLSFSSFPCPLLYVLSHLYPTLALLPLSLRALRVLHTSSLSPSPCASPPPSPSSPTSSPSLIARKALARLSSPPFQVALLLTGLLLSSLGAVLLAALDSASQSLALSSPPSCPLFSPWHYFVPVCGLLFLLYTLLVLTLAGEEAKSGGVSAELSCVWLLYAVFAVAYFVLDSLPPEQAVDAAFPLTSLVIALHALVHSTTVIGPLITAARSTQRAASGAQKVGEQGTGAARPTSTYHALEAAHSTPGKRSSAVVVGKRGTIGATGAPSCPDAAVPPSADPFDASTSVTAPAPDDLPMDVTNVWSMERILHDPTANALLLAHATRSLCPELVLAYNAIDAFNAHPRRITDPADLDAAYAQALSIYHQFIKVGSGMEVNVDSKIRAGLAAVFEGVGGEGGGVGGVERRRAVMVRDLHAKKKLRREMERKAAAQKVRQMQHRTGIISTKHSRGGGGLGVGVGLGVRPVTPSLQPSQPHHPSSPRSNLHHTATSALTSSREGTGGHDLLVIVGDEEGMGDGRRGSGGWGGGGERGEGEDIHRTMQPEVTGELTTLQAVTVSPLHPFAEPRTVRSATVNYPAPTLSLDAPSPHHFTSQPTFSQTLQMPLNSYSSLAQPPSDTSDIDTSLAPIPPPTDPTPTIPAFTPSDIDPTQHHHRSSTAPLTTEATSCDESAMSSTAESDDRFGALVVNYEGQPAVPAGPSLESPSGSTSGQGVGVVDEQRRGAAESASDVGPTVVAAELVAVTRATQPSEGSRVSRGGAALSTTWSGRSLSLSAGSTPFPLSALEVAALSSQVLWQRCQHELKRLMDTNLYLSFIRQSADFRKHRLAKRREEREAQAARKAMARQEAEALSTGQVHLALQPDTPLHAAVAAPSVGPVRVSDSDQHSGA